MKVRRIQVASGANRVSFIDIPTGKDVKDSMDIACKRSKQKFNHVIDTLLRKKQEVKATSLWDKYSDLWA